MASAGPNCQPVSIRHQLPGRFNSTCAHALQVRYWHLADLSLHKDDVSF